MGYHLQAVHWSNLALVTLALIELSGFPSNLAVVMLAVFELSGFSSHLALVTLQLFGLYGFSSLLHILLLFFIPTFSCLLFAVTFRFAVCFDYCLCGACSLLSPCESFWGQLSLALHGFCLISVTEPCTMAWLPFSLLWLSCAPATFWVAAIPSEAPYT